MDEKERDLEFKNLENEHKNLKGKYEALADRERRTRKRLWNHLYFTRYVLGTIACISLFVLVFAIGAYAFLRGETQYDSTILNQEITRVPFYGIAIIGWIVILVLIGLLWLYLFYWYNNRDCNDC